MITIYEKKPELVRVIQYDGTNLEAIRVELQLLSGALYYDGEQAMYVDPFTGTVSGVFTDDFIVYDPIKDQLWPYRVNEFAVKFKLPE